MDSGPQGDSCLVTRILPDPEIIGDNPLPSSRTYCKASRYVMAINYVLLVVSSANRVRDKGTLWCSSARPTGDKPFWAIGTSDGLHTLEGQQGEWTLSRTRMPYPEVPSGTSRERKRMLPDITTVEWLTPDVVISGLRNSAILFHDLRSGGWVGRLQHAHSVSKIRKIDDYRLVVAGFKSVSLCLMHYIHSYCSEYIACNVRSSVPNKWRTSNAQTEPRRSHVDQALHLFYRVQQRPGAHN
jgi:hypothetical protein